MTLKHSIPRAKSIIKKSKHNIKNKKTFTLSAIPTNYKGITYRSRLEARWATYFDNINYKFEYELEGYDLGRFGWYLPDFYLINTTNCYIEIKPTLPDRSYLRKLYEFAKHIDEPFYIAVGTPSPDNIILYRFDITIENPPEQSILKYLHRDTTLCYFSTLKHGKPYINCPCEQSKPCHEYTMRAISRSRNNHFGGK